ncbi:hypothetical protein CHUAL_000014 [Chamberlinius hualienensis]
MLLLINQLPSDRGPFHHLEMRSTFYCCSTIFNHMLLIRKKNCLKIHLLTCVLVLVMAFSVNECDSAAMAFAEPAPKPAAYAGPVPKPAASANPEPLSRGRPNRGWGSLSKLAYFIGK